MNKEQEAHRLVDIIIDECICSVGKDKAAMTDEPAGVGKGMSDLAKAVSSPKSPGGKSIPQAGKDKSALADDPDSPEKSKSDARKAVGEHKSELLNTWMSEGWLDKARKAVKGWNVKAAASNTGIVAQALRKTKKRASGAGDIKKDE